MRASKLTKETIRNISVTDRGFPKFKVGDTVEVAQIVKEGNKERIQKFIGDVIAIHNKGISSTFTVRRMGANNIGVEKIFPFHAPMINNIKVVKRGDVCRSKLYYIRERVGKSARIKERVQTKKELASKAEVKTAEAEPTPEATTEE